jgi:hypothetical protein
MVCVSQQYIDSEAKREKGKGEKDEGPCEVIDLCKEVQIKVYFFFI